MQYRQYRYSIKLQQYTTSKMSQFFDLCFLDSTGEYSTHMYVYWIPTYKLSLIIGVKKKGMRK
jgi:hypothetical protein